MILACPNCHARFMVNDAAFGTVARRVRCGKCRHDWEAAPPAPEAIAIDTVIPPLVADPIPPGSNLPAIPTTSGKQKVIKAAKAITAVGVMVLGGWLLLTTVLGSFMFTTGSNGPVLTLGEIKTRYEENTSNSYVLVVEGDIRNTGNEDGIIPPIRVIVKDAEGKTLNEGMASVQRAELLVNDRTDFVYSVDPVPDGISEVTVEFVTEQGTKPADEHNAQP